MGGWGLEDAVKGVDSISFTNKCLFQQEQHAPIRTQTLKSLTAHSARDGDVPGKSCELISSLKDIFVCFVLFFRAILTMTSSCERVMGANITFSAVMLQEVTGSDDAGCARTHDTRRVLGSVNHDNWFMK